MGKFVFVVFLLSISAGCRPHATVRFEPGVLIADAFLYAEQHNASVLRMGRTYERHGQMITEGLAVQPGWEVLDVSRTWAARYKHNLEANAKHLEEYRRRLSTETDPSIKATYERAIIAATMDQTEAAMLIEEAYGETILVTSMTLSIGLFRGLTKTAEVSEIERSLF